MRNQGTAPAIGDLGLRVIRGGATPAPAGRPGKELSFREIVHYSNPSNTDPAEVAAWKRENLRRIIGPAVRRFGPARAIARRLGLPYMWSQLWLRVIRADGTELDYGLAGLRVVTNAGVAAIVDAFQDSVELETFKYHGVGTGSTAEAAADTDLVTELTTEYTTNSTRATGTTAEGASANIYQTVATNSFDASVALEEHGIFTSATVGSGTLLDRTVFSVINLGSGDSLESTYELTFSAGS